MAKYAYHRIDGNAGEVITAMREEGASVEPLGRPVDVAVGMPETQTAVAGALLVAVEGAQGRVADQGGWASVGAAVEAASGGVT
jgi:hypothetical protein